MSDMNPEFTASDLTNLVVHMHDQIEDEDKTNPKPLPPVSAEALAAIAKIWADAGTEMDKDAEARKEAEANGTIADCDVPVDQRGHLFSKDTVTNRRSLDFYLKDSGKPVITSRKALPDATDADENGDCPILTVASTVGLRNPCYWCGEKAVAAYDGTIVRVTTDCALAGGFTTVTELVVTSGKVVIADDLSEFYYVNDEEHTTMNTAAGRAGYAKASAALGCVFAYLGDHGPSLYRVGENAYAIAADGSTDDYQTIAFDGEPLTDILLDARAYSIADYDDFAAKGGTIDEDEMDVIDLPNGVYTFSCHRDEASFDFDMNKTKVFTTITRTDLP